MFFIFSCKSIKEYENDVSLLFYVIRRNLLPETRENLCCQALYFREMKSKALIFPKMSPLLIILTFNNM